MTRENHAPISTHRVTICDSYTVRIDCYPLNHVTISSLRDTIFVESKPPKPEPNRVKISLGRAMVFDEASTSILSKKKHNILGNVNLCP